MMPNSMENDIAEIKRDVKEIASLVKRHDVSLYGQNYDNGLVSDVRDSRKWITGANKMIWTLVLGFIGQVGYLLFRALSKPH
jgi:hypothetical protein